MAKESGNLIDTMEDFFKKAPAIPANGREALVNIMPWIALIFGILGILTALGGIGLLTVFSPLAVFSGASGVASYGGTVLATWVYLGASVLLLAAYPGTKAKKLSGWNLLFWSDVVNVIASLVGGAIVSAVVWGLVGFYLLFQIKSYYK
jgi:hypothetical protein